MLLWHIYGDADKHIPPATMKFTAERAGAKEPFDLIAIDNSTSARCM